LFHGAISESGVALSPFTDRKEDPLKEAKKLAVALDCPTSDSSFMVECLRRVSAAELTKATISVHPSHWVLKPQISYVYFLIITRGNEVLFV